MSTLLNLKFQRVAPATVRDIVADWPAQSYHLAYELISIYQMPHEATQHMLIWYYNGAWKRTVLHRDGMPHNIPHLHTDILEQTIDERVQTDAYSQIAKFDGSIIIDRTRGEMTAYCESERANTFLLNLAHDIIIEKKTAEEARDVLMQSSDFFHSMIPNHYRDSLLFSSQEGTNDPDIPQGITGYQY